MYEPEVDRSSQLRSMLSAGVLAPGCYDALSAALIAEAGFAAAFVTGAGIAYCRLGRPDIGLVSMNEVAETVALIADRVDLPLIVDADTGFGNALNVWRTVRVFERAGASAIQLEDQQMPKRCGHLAGKTLVSTQEMVGKLKSALDTRDRALIVARTDAVAVEGLERAIERAEHYLEAGADVLFIEAPPSIDAMRAICDRFSGRVPLVANMLEGGSTPMLEFARLTDLGFRLVIFPGTIARAMVHSVRQVLKVLARDGSTACYRGEMVDLSGINELVETPLLLARASRYEPSALNAGDA